MSGEPSCATCRYWSDLVAEQRGTGPLSRRDPRRRVLLFAGACADDRRLTERERRGDPTTTTTAARRDDLTGIIG